MMEHSDTNQEQQNVSGSSGPLPTMSRPLNTAQPTPTPSVLEIYGASEIDADRGTDDVNTFIEQYCIANDLPLEIGKTRTERKCSVIAHRAKEEFKRYCSLQQCNTLGAQPESHPAPHSMQRVSSAEMSFSNPVQSGAHCVSGRSITQRNDVPFSPPASVSTEDARRMSLSRKYKVRLRNNRRSAHASKVYREIWLRAMSLEISKLEEKKTDAPSAVRPTLDDNSSRSNLSVPPRPINRSAPAIASSSSLHRMESQPFSPLHSAAHMPTLENQPKKSTSFTPSFCLQDDLKVGEKSIAQTSSDSMIQTTSPLQVGGQPNMSATTVPYSSCLFLEKENERLRGILSQYVSSVLETSEYHGKSTVHNSSTASFGSSSVQPQYLKRHRPEEMVLEGVRNSSEALNISDSSDDETRRAKKKK